ncbi:MAG: hypothetical protein KIT52_20545 [Anaerolineae bacterium]|nr:hypothetical protein [Anaerolineae bacterium]
MAISNVMALSCNRVTCVTSYASRLTLVIALLYVQVVAFGSAVIKRGDRHLVDRIDRRDLSIFRIGYDMWKVSHQ